MGIYKQISRDVLTSAAAYLTLDVGLCADTGARIADAATVTATDFTRRADVLAGVFLLRVDLLHARLTQHHASLTCGHRLQEVVIVQLPINKSRYYLPHDVTCSAHVKQLQKF